MDLGIYLIIAALIGAKLMLIVVDYRTSRRIRASAVARARGRRVLRRADPRSCRTLAGAPAAADVEDGGHVRAGHRARPCHRSAPLLAGCCYGKVTDVAWAIVYESDAAPDNAARRSTSRCIRTQLYDAGAELLILIFLLAFERRGKPFAGRTFWLHPALCDLAIHRGDLSRRSARHGNGALDVAVRVGGDRADCARDAGAAAQDLPGRRLTMSRRCSAVRDMLLASAARSRDPRPIDRRPRCGRFGLQHATHR